MIVLNGEPFMLYNLRALYPHAHQIIIVEGACRTSLAVADPLGHSLDGTLETVRRFQAGEDPEHKVILVTASDEGYTDGFWPEKTEMSQAYARRATGNYLWQIDSDEFYHEEDIERMRNLLARGGISAVTFPQYSFWGGTEYYSIGFHLAALEHPGDSYTRLFAWGPGYVYARHRPPTVVDARGIDVRKHGWKTAAEMAKLGIYRYHYSFVFPFQVMSKVNYYSVNSKEKTHQGGGYNPSMDAWHRNYQTLRHPYHVHNAFQNLSWLVRFRGAHPIQVLRMREDIESGRLAVKVRSKHDIEKVLNTPSYRFITGFLTLMLAITMTPAVYPFYKTVRAATFRFHKAFPG
jgi:hypothetical protein